MTWSRVQQASAALNGGFTAATATVTPTFGAGTTAGHLLVAFVNWASQFTTYGAGDAFTFPSGWVRADHTATGAANYEELWYYPNCPSGITSVAITSTRPGGINNAVVNSWIGEFSGGATSSPLEQVGHATGTGTAVSVSTSVADAAAGNLVIMCAGWQTTTLRTFAVGSGYTAETVTQSNNIVQGNLFGEHETSAGATTQTATGTISASQTWGAVIATFKSGTLAPAATGALTLGAPILTATTEIGGQANAALTLGAPQVAGEVTGAGGQAALILPAPDALGAGAVLNPVLSGIGALLPAPLVLGTEVYATAAGALVLPPPALGVVTAERLGPPTISSVSPSIGGEITQIVIIGTNFLTATDVLFGSYHYYGYPFSALITIVSDTEIHVFAPDPFYLSTDDLDNLTVDVSVVTPDGTATAVAAYTIVAPPVIESITPTLWFPGDPSPTLIITGKNFQTSFSVEFGPYAIGSSFAITADGSQVSVPLFSFSGIAPGVYPVRVWNDSGPSAVANPLFTVAYVAQTPQAADLADALAGRYGPVVIQYVYEWHNRDNSFIADISTAVDQGDGCTLHLDNDQGIASTADFHLLATNLPAGFSATPASGKCIAVYAEIVTPVTTYTLQKGLFHTDEPQVDQFPLGWEEWQAKASDVLVVLSERTTTATYWLLAGANYYQSIQAICTQFGLRLEGTAVPPQNLPADVSWPAKTSYLQICNDLALGLNNFALFADETGLVQLVPRVNPELVPAGTTYDATAEPTMLAGEATLPSSRVVNTAPYKNFVVVAIDDPARDAYTTTYTNADPTSPLSTTASGKEDVLTVNGSSTPSSKAIYDTATADAIAIFELKDEATRAVQRTIHTFPDPRRTHHENVRLKIPGFEDNTLWRVLKWDLPCTTGADMVHVLAVAAPIAVGSGAPSLTVIRQRIAAQGAAGTSPLGDTWLTFPVTETTLFQNGLVCAAMADTPPSTWYATDTQGNVYAACAVSDGFGPAGTKLYLGAFASITGNVLSSGVDSVTIHLGSGMTVCAGGAWEITGLSDTAPDGAPAAAQSSSPTNTNTEQNPISGLTGPGAGMSDPSSGLGTADLVLGLVGAVWDAHAVSPGSVLPESFTVDTGLGFDKANETVVPTNAAGALFAELWIELGLAQGAGQWSVSGVFSGPAIGWGALCVAIPGTAVVP